MTEQPAECLDLIWGVSSIAEMIGRTERQTYGMLVSGHLPAKQIGTRWVAKREALVKFFDEVAA